MKASKTLAIALLLVFSLFFRMEAFSQTPYYKKGTKKSPLMQKLEDKLGKPLTEAQKEQVDKTAWDMLMGMKKTHDKLIQDLASITGLTQDQIKSFIPSKEKSGPEEARNFVPKLENAMGRKMTEDEKNKLRKAFADMLDGMVAHQQKFIDQLSKITGLSKDAVKECLPKPGERLPRPE